MEIAASGHRRATEAKVTPARGVAKITASKIAASGRHKTSVQRQTASEIAASGRHKAAETMVAAMQGNVSSRHVGKCRL